MLRRPLLENPKASPPYEYDDSHRGKDWEFLTRFSVSPSLPKQGLRGASLLCWQQQGLLQHALISDTDSPAFLPLFLKAATDNNTWG
ncbi:hypothetical protein VNO78_04033 [Psophocarpus tetragonolobus]|uniref:Uncharacterized protein n=1 Tax=Psophocarpus tetragonolobus TaxID=3891 RepID=A0AAN9T2H3_PSOTE